MSTTYGTKRLVVGAHYGLRDWLAQRVTALLIALLTIVVILRVIFTSGPIGYDAWSAVFAPQWMKFLTFVAILSVIYHAWVGVRDIWMDYVKPAGLRLLFYVATIVWLVGCAGWALQVLWRL